MKTIYKYTLTNRVTDLELPIGAEILTAKWFNEEIVIWAIVDTDAPTEIRRIVGYQTGDEIGPVIRHIATVAIASKYNKTFSLIEHIFEVPL